MNEWYDLPQKDGDYYYLKVVEVYTDDTLEVVYEIYKNECEDPIQIDFFQDEIYQTIKQVKRDYIKFERENA